MKLLAAVLARACASCSAEAALIAVDVSAIKPGPISVQSSD